MHHLLIAGKLHPSGMRLLESTPDVTYDYVEEISEDSYAPLIENADALVLRTQPLSASTIARAKQLKLVSRHGVGYDAVDVTALNERRIPLCIVGDVNSTSVAEHAMLLILSAIKRLTKADRAVRQGPWGWRNLLEAGELSGKRLLILGYGRIGRALARMAAGFDMEVRAHDPYLASKGWPDGDVHSESTLMDGLAWADIVSVNVPRADRPILGVNEIAGMRRGAVLVNTARGGIVDEMALADALSSGQLGAAGLDVFDEEPPPDGHPLLSLEEVVLTPHIAGLTQECAERMAISSVQNVLDFFGSRLDSDLIVNSDF